MNNKDKSLVLIVDDNPLNLQILGNLLKDNGYKPALAQNGVAALDFVQKKQPDLILLDILMPEMDGIETCKRLKARETIKDIPVIFITALTKTPEKVKAFEVGGVDYITKPFQSEEVLARVEAHLTVRKLQQELQEQNEVLEKYMSLLANQNEQLEELNASKDKFFSIIAHDLRGPLSSLRQLTQLIAENLERYRQNTLKDVIDQQCKETENIFNLMQNLLTWARLQQGAVKHHPEPIGIKMIVERSVALLTPNAEQKRITLKNALQAEVFVYADINMLDTVVRNLVSNALKFTHPGGSVSVSAKQKEDTVEVSVSDSGIGMSEEDLPKLFRIGTKYKCLGTAHEQGTGLGLILCKEFIEKHGGRIWVESEVDKGTTFTFTLQTTTNLG